MPRSLDFEYLLTPAGLERHRRVQIDDAGRIKSVGAAGDQRFDARFALPGMPNAHSHAFQRAMVGLGEAKAGDDSFWSWRRHMYGLAAILGPDDLYAIARRAYADMLAAGYTSVAEFHYLHHLPDGSSSAEMGRAVIAAARDIGIRLVFLPVYYQQGGFGQAARPEQKRFLHASADAYCELLRNFADVPCGIAPHSLRAVPADQLTRLVSAAEELLGKDFPIHIHVSEQLGEVEECIKYHGARPVEVLARSVDLDDRWSLVHATHADANERAIIVGSGARVVLCPLTEAYLGDGVFAAREYAKVGGRWAIGSDSNVRIDAIEEIRLLEYGQRLVHQQRACLADNDGLGGPLWRHMTTTGAEALRLDVGAIESGRFADFVTLDTSSSSLSGVAPENILDAWVTAGSRENIDCVYVGGNKLVFAGKAAAETEVASDYAKAMTAIRARTKA